jgi:hypothetical protein
MRGGWGGEALRSSNKEQPAGASIPPFRLADTVAYGERFLTVIAEHG